MDAIHRHQALQQQALWRQLQQKTADMPIDQAEAAVGAAMRFQAQRQYQEDLKSGMSPNEALSRNAPLLFSSPKNSSLGQAASFIKASEPRLIDVGGVLYRGNPDRTVTPMTQPKPTPPRLINSGGVLYRQNADGSVTPMTKAPPAAADKPSHFDTSEYSEVLGQIRKIQEESSDDVIGSKDFKTHQNQLKYLQESLDRIRQRTGAPTVPKAPASATSGKRVRVRNSDGKTGTIPADQLESALSQGFTEVK